MIVRNLQQVERIESKIGKSKDIEEGVFLLSSSTEFTQEGVLMLRTNLEQVIEKYLLPRSSCFADGIWRRPTSTL